MISLSSCPQLDPVHQHFTSSTTCLQIRLLDFVLQHAPCVAFLTFGSENLCFRSSTFAIVSSLKEESVQVTFTAVATHSTSHPSENPPIASPLVTMLHFAFRSGLFCDRTFLWKWKTEVALNVTSGDTFSEQTPLREGMFGYVLCIHLDSCS